MLFVSDLHGSDKAFFKLTNAAPLYKASIVVIGGDIAGKTLTPMFEGTNGFEAEIVGTKKLAKSKEEVEALDKEIRFQGNYPYKTTVAEWNELMKDEKKMMQVFEQVIAESVSRWCTIAEERLKPKSIRFVVNKGNDDPETLRRAIETSGYVEYPDEKVTDIDGFHEMISLGYSNPTPWNLPGDITEEELSRKLEKVCSGVKRMEGCVFNIHVPPIGTHLDVAPLLNPDLSLKLSPGGEPEMGHVGSTAVKAGIEKHQPLIGLHGHIHESRGYTKIGRTHCFNPGSEYNIGVLKGVLLDLDNGKLAGHAFTSG